MIELNTKIHDRFTLELKVGFNTKEAIKPMKYSDFVMNTWIFVPQTLDINAAKYSKDTFYRDLKSDVRLITPDYPLDDLANDEDLLPNQALSNDFEQMLTLPGDTSNLVHAIKMYCAIAKSALRDRFEELGELSDSAALTNACRQYLDAERNIIGRYRRLIKRLDESKADERTRQIFAYGDEFLSNVVEKYTYRLRDYIRQRLPEEYAALQPGFKDLLLGEKAYKQDQGYLCVKADDPKENSGFVSRASRLKKFAESDLYLNANKRKNTFLVEQILYSLAAGAAMGIATLSSFFFQQRYGNFTLPFLIALVVSYMFKDRLKDWLRLFFAKRLSNKVFDARTDFSIKGKHIGWSKDSVDFIDLNKVLPEVMHVRDRLALLAEVSGNDEKVLLYRKKVQVWPAELAKASPFPLKGINDIMRYNLTEFTRKMDNPKFPLAGTWEDRDYKPIEGHKVYEIVFVVQCVFEGKTEYKRIAVQCDKNGIVDVATRL